MSKHSLGGGEMKNKKEKKVEEEEKKEENEVARTVTLGEGRGRRGGATKRPKKKTTL